MDGPTTGAPGQATFCPQCGTQRAGSFRYCAKCGHDFEPPTPSYSAKYAGTEFGRSAAPSPAPPATQRPSARPVLLIGAVAAVLVLAFVIATNRSVVSSNPTLNADVDLPPAGSIWFGSSFDSSTFAIRGRTDSVGANQPFSFVAHLSRSMDASELVIRISWNSSLVSSTKANATGNGDVWGFSPGPLFEAGTWRYELTDVGGNVLASGSIMAT